LDSQKSFLSQNKTLSKTCPSRPYQNVAILIKSKKGKKIEVGIVFE